MELENNNLDNCCHCGSKVKKNCDSLHCWEIEYECGYRIVGAIDTKEHGSDTMVLKKCPQEKNLK